MGIIQANVVFVAFLLFLQRQIHATEAPHVCIIGGGIASASTAHFLTEVPSFPKPKLTIFEKTSSLGGRVSTLKLNTTEGEVVTEAGASIIASSNKLMSYFTDLLKLSKREPRDGTLGLWDGNAFVMRTDGKSRIQILAELVLRYRLAFFRMKQFVKHLTTLYSSVYPADGAPWRAQLDAKGLFSGAPELYNQSQVSFKEVAMQFNSRYSREMVSAITRVNYGQDPEQMNGFSGSVALAGSGGGLWAVGGGNKQVIDGLIKRSGAEVLLDTVVDSVTVEDSDNNRRMYTLHSGATAWVCDAVVMAVPYELAEIALPTHMKKQVDIGRNFQRTHTTFVQGHLNEDTFGKSPPDTILTIEGTSELFTSIGTTWRGDGSEDIPIYKIFSKQVVDEDVMLRIFKRGGTIIAKYPWLAYPQFAPPEKIPSFDVVGERGAFFYTSPIESLGSAMEQSAVSGANAASLIRERLHLVIADTKADLQKEEL